MFSRRPNEKFTNEAIKLENSITNTKSSQEKKPILLYTSPH